MQQNAVHQGGVFFIRNSISGGEDGMLAHAGSSTKIADKSLRCVAEGEHTYWVGASDHHIYEIEKNTNKVVRILQGHTNSVFAIEQIDKYTLLSTGRDASIKAWDLTLGKVVHSVPAHDYQAKSLSYNGEILLSSSMDKTIKLWDTELNLLKIIDLQRHTGHTSCVNKIEWLNKDMFVSCSDDRSLLLWKVEILP